MMRLLGTAMALKDRFLEQPPLDPEFLEQFQQELALLSQTSHASGGESRAIVLGNPPPLPPAPARTKEEKRENAACAAKLGALWGILTDEEGDEAYLAQKRRQAGKLKI
jgi:hypothetical protein